MLNRVLLGVIAGGPLQSVGDGGTDPGDSMPITTVGMTGRGNSDPATSVTVTMPTGTEPGDFAVLFVMTRAGVNTPTGWSRVGESLIASASGATQQIIAFSKYLTSTTAFTVSSSGGSDRMDWTATTFRSGRTLALRDMVSSLSTAAEPDSLRDTVTPTRSGKLLLSASTIPKLPSQQYAVGVAPAGTGELKFYNISASRLGSYTYRDTLYLSTSNIETLQQFTGLSGGLVSLCAMVS